MSDDLRAALARVEEQLGALVRQQAALSARLDDPTARKDLGRASELVGARAVEVGLHTEDGRELLALARRLATEARR